MLFAMYGRFKPGVEDKRQEIHERYNEHLSQRAAPVHFGGPIYDENGQRAGVLWIVEARDFEAAQAFLRHSPYEQAGLYEETHISEIRPEVGRIA